MVRNYNLNREPGYFWHNLGKAAGSRINEWWNFLCKNSQLSAGFESKPGDKGEEIMRKYIAGDIVVAYAKKYGAVGWGVVADPPSYRLIETGSEDDFFKGGEKPDHLHRISVNWNDYAIRVEEAIKPDELMRVYNIMHPLQTRVKISNHANAEKLIKSMKEKFGQNLVV